MTGSLYSCTSICTPVGGTSDSIMAPVGAGASCLLLDFLLFQIVITSDVVWHSGISSRWTAYGICESSFLIHHCVYYVFFVCP